MSNHKKIVITGASGFLGSHLVERLKGDERYDVYALSSRPNELKEKFGGGNIVYINKDALSMEVLKDAIVVNCAYPRNSTGTAIADGLKYIQRVFESAVENFATAIINISSQSVYSQQRIEAATEKSSVCLETPYAVGKYAVELMIGSICKGSRTKYTSLRMASLIGPGFNQRIVNRLIRFGMENDCLVVDDSEQLFGFMDVKDAAEAIECLILHEKSPWNEVYNLSNNNAYTLVYIAENIKVVFWEKEQKKIDIQKHNNDKKYNTSVNANSFCNSFGFSAKYGLNDSIRRIFDDIKQNGLGKNQ